MKFKLSALFFLILTNIYGQTPDFESNGLLYLRDSDYNSNSQETKTAIKEGIDLLGAFTFPLTYSSSQKPSEQNISNSVFYNHRPIAIHTGKKIAYIIESESQIDKNAEKVELEEIHPGGYVSVISFSDLNNIKPEYRFPVADEPTSITLDKSNRYLAISSNSPGNEIQIFELDMLGKPLRALPGVSFFKAGAINDLIWRPDGTFLVFIDREDKELGLIKAVYSGSGIIRLEQFGEPVKFEGEPVSGTFSPDGNILFVLDKGNPDQNIKGSVYALKLSFDENHNHSFLSKALVDINPGQISISPDGSTLLVTNSLYSNRSATFGQSSISVLGFQNSVLINRLNYPIDGILPGQAKFDRLGRNFAIPVFQTKAFGKPMGLIQFYKFTKGDMPKIELQKSSINMPSGIHYLEVFN